MFNVLETYPTKSIVNRSGFLLSIEISSKFFGRYCLVINKGNNIQRKNSRQEKLSFDDLFAEIRFLRTLSHTFQNITSFLVSDTTNTLFFQTILHLCRPV